MRKKTKQSVDVAAVTGAWQAFFDKQNTHTVEGLNKNGWLDIYTIAENMNVNPRTVSRSASKLGLEERSFRVMWKGHSRDVKFCRVK
jgi:hypothetical protein